MTINENRLQPLMVATYFFLNFVIAMSKIWLKIKVVLRRMRATISPAFVYMLCAAVIMWYILKLQYTYTTNYSVLVNIDGERMRIPCVVEGKGTNLFGYRVYMHREIKIALDDLKYSIEEQKNPDTGVVEGRSYVIDPQSVQSILSVRFSDIKLISVGEVPAIPVEESEAVDSAS